MATGGLENSISGGHDIVPDWPCKPCEETDSIIEAIVYCRNCDEAYCKSCLRHHNRLAKGHDVLGQADRSDWGKAIVDQRVIDQSTVLDSGVKCSEHEGEKINMYCGHHDDVCCSVCAVMNHSDICKPKMAYVPRAATGIASSAELKDFMAKRDQLITRITQIENEKEEYDSKLEASREACKNTVEEIDDRVRRRLENLKVNTLSEIDALHDEEILKNDDVTNTCKDMRQDLHALHQLLQPSQPVNEASVFVTLKMNRRKLQSYSQLCDELNNAPTKTFTIQQDPAIIQLQQTASFGKIEVKDVKHREENVTGDNGNDNGGDACSNARRPPAIPPRDLTGKRSASALADFDIRRDQIEMQDEIGAGQFGSVFKGMCTMKTSERVPVAIKKLALVQGQENELIKEAKAIVHLTHKHIVRIIGLCQSDSIMLVLELAPLGQLNTYLRNHMDTTQANIVELMWQVAMGMEYLESKRVVHRELMARNVLLVSERFAKISYFGMSRTLNIDEDYYETQSAGKWPLKWLAPECVYYWKFDSNSDVWSYGVTMWEALTYGKNPYQKMKNHDVLKFIVEEGKRLPQPDNCSNEVYQLMLNCWEYEKTERPTFSQLAQDMHVIYNRLLSPVRITVIPPKTEPKKKWFKK